MALSRISYRRPVRPGNQSLLRFRITFLDPADPERLFASTFEQEKRDSLLSRLRKQRPPLKQIVDLQFSGEHFVSYSLPLPTENGTAVALLERSLDKELAPYLRLERTYLFLALLGLLVSAALGISIAQRFPAGFATCRRHTQVGAGDYSHRIKVRTDDEIGLLAGAFNRMSEGLAERDQVRDLLGKVVSPAVATELLRKDVTLGGEEREVTILFPICEASPACVSPRPRKRCWESQSLFHPDERDREAHRGVVDKYVGDAMMALSAHRSLVPMMSSRHGNGAGNVRSAG